MVGGRQRRSSRRRWRQALAVPASRTESFVEGGAEVRLHEWPVAGRTTPVATIVLIPGLGMGHGYFSVLRFALNREANVVGVDLPGFGGVPRPEHHASVPETARLLALALEEAGYRDVVLLGHSMGAQVAAEIAAQRPELVHAVVFVGPTVNPAEQTWWQQALRLTIDVLNDPPIVRMVGGAQYLKAGTAWMVTKLGDMLDHHILEPAGRLPQPALVVRGGQDLVCPPEWAAALTAAIPNARLKTAGQRGHETMISDAEPLAEMVLRFVKETP